MSFRQTRNKLHRMAPALLRRLTLLKYLNFNYPLTISGKRFSIPIRGGIGEELLKETPDFKSEIISIFGNQLPDCFSDVGPNIGQTILQCFSQRQWSTYYALEPSVLACAYLDALVKTNQLPVVILPWAVGPNSEPHCLYAKGPLDAAATMKPSDRPGQYNSSMATWVATYPFDLLLDQANLPSGLMIKIDVEGFEAEVLAGANKILDTLRPVLLCEVLRAYNEPEIRFVHERMTRLETTLKRHGFRIFNIEFDNGKNGRIQGFKELSNFPRGLWRDDPSGIDYLFIPAEKPLPEAKFY